MSRRHQKTDRGHPGAKIQASGAAVIDVEVAEPPADELVEFGAAAFDGSVSLSGLAPFDILANYERRSLAHVVGLPEQLDAPGLWRGVGYRIGHKRLASGFDEVVEILPMPQVTPVPGAQPWLLGVANIRGNLYSVIDFGRFLGRESPPSAGQARLVLFGARAAEMNVGLVVTRVLGLRNVAELAPAAPPQDVPEWYAQRWMDGDGNAWQEIDLSILARDPAFLQVGL